MKNRRKSILYIAVILWEFYAITGILKNYSYYSFGDWLVVFPLVLLPCFLIYRIRTKHGKSESRVQFEWKKIFCAFWGIMFLFASLGGVINCFYVKADLVTFIVCVTFTIFFFVMGITILRAVIRTSSNKRLGIQEPAANQTPSKTVKTALPQMQKNNPNYPQYIENGNIISHTDGSPITDEEVPYLMQLGYEEALRKTKQYNGEVLDTSFVTQNLAEKRSATIVPSYQEILRFPTNLVSNVSSTDIFFLKYIDGRPVEKANIAQYWYYEYGLNYTDEIRKLYSSDLLNVSNINISKLKVEDLKNILRHFNLQLSGKKVDLINRISDNISPKELSSFLGDSVHYFCATNKGIALIESINDSATFNLELENEALSLIMNSDYKSAFSLIWNYKRQTPAEKNSHYEYSAYMDEMYDSIMIPEGFFYTLDKDRDIEGKIRAALVFCRMYGLGQDKTRKLIIRIYKENGHEFSADAANLINGRLL